MPTATQLCSLLLLVACFATGCADRRAKTDEFEINLRRIVQAFDVAASSRGRAPQDIEHLKRSFKDIGETRDPNVVLRSERDGQPYVILFGYPLHADDRNTIMAYERQGKDGKRYVLTLSREIKILSDAEFAAAVFAGGHQPAVKQ